MDILIDTSMVNTYSYDIMLNMGILMFRTTTLKLDFINQCYLFIDDSITIEGDMTEQHPCIWCNVDGRLKMKLTFRDQIVLDISMNNDANIRGAYLHLPTARVTGKYD